MESHVIRLLMLTKNVKKAAENIHKIQPMQPFCVKSLRAGKINLTCYTPVALAEIRECC